MQEEGYYKIKFVSVYTYTCICVSICPIVAPKRINWFWLNLSRLKDDLIENVLSYDLRKSVQPFEDPQLWNNVEIIISDMLSRHNLVRSD